jgi:hypothetical protein
MRSLMWCRSPAGSAVSLNGTIATTFGCPFEGKIDEDRVLQIVEAYLELGIHGHDRWPTPPAWPTRDRCIGWCNAC